jgi:2-dehydropantoate 2-reductase
MKFGIVGAGGIGGYLAAKLINAGHDVAVLARGRQLEAIRADGLRLVDPDGDLTVTLKAISDDPAVLGAPDLIIFAVKAHQLPDAIAQIAAQVGPGTRLLPIQNGVDAPDMLAKAFGPDRALIGSARIFTNITGPGVITRYGDPKSFTIGTMAGDQTGNGVPEILAAFRDAGIDAPTHADARIELWTKLMIFNAMSSVTTATRLRFGEFRCHGETNALVRRLMQETFDVARASGVPLPDGLTDQTYHFYLNVLPDEGRTSMAQDLEEGRALEIDHVCGAVARRGRALGVDVTASETIHAVLTPWKAGR